MKLELKHLAPYLPYGLKMQAKHTNLEYSTMTLCDKTGLSNIGISDVIDDIECFKPILRPLSDLTKQQEADICEYSDIERVVFSGNPSTLYFTNTEEKTYLDDYLDTLNYLFKNHFDVFGLIPNGLAIDINTL